MTKFELSMSANYVESWRIVEAVRELFQNALDEQTKDSNNTMFFDYDGESILRIGNKNSTLDIQSLLIGNTTKHDDKYIGRHGEGYKLATIVLLRENCKVTFYNYNSREVWTTRLVKSRKYRGALVPTFFVEKVPVWSKIPDNSLMIEVIGITPDDYSEIKESNLHLQDDVSSISTQYGDLLTSERHLHKIYVNGLYVCDNNGSVHYGYNFSPLVIRLDRDRRMVDDFNLRWNSSKIIGEIDDADIVDKAIRCGDGEYIRHNDNRPINKVVANKIATNFVDKYGEKSIPVSSNYEFNELSSNSEYKPVMVTDAQKVAITSSDIYKKPVIEEKEPLIGRIEEWFERADLSDDDHNTFEPLLKELREVL